MHRRCRGGRGCLGGSRAGAGSQGRSHRPSQGAGQPRPQCAPPWGEGQPEARTSVHGWGFLKRQTGSFAHSPGIPDVFKLQLICCLNLQVSVHPSSPNYPNACNLRFHPRACTQEQSPAHPAEHLGSHICHLPECLCCSGFLQKPNFFLMR